MDNENESDTLKPFTAKILLVIWILIIGCFSLILWINRKINFISYSEMEKQEQLKQKLAAKKDRKAEKRKIKEEKKNQPAELHGSWASAKRQKEQTVIQKFEGKKITFDDSD